MQARQARIVPFSSFPMRYLITKAYTVSSVISVMRIARWFTDVSVLIHDRMPVVLDPNRCDLWLDPAMTHVSAVSDPLKPYDARLTQYYRVSIRVHSVAPAVGIRKVAQCLAASWPEGNPHTLHYMEDAEPSLASRSPCR